MAKQRETVDNNTVAQSSHALHPSLSLKQQQKGSEVRVDVFKQGPPPRTPPGHFFPFCARRSLVMR